MRGICPQHLLLTDSSRGLGMERVRVVVKEIAYAENHAKLSPGQRSVIIPVLSLPPPLSLLLRPPTQAPVLCFHLGKTSSF